MSIASIDNNAICRSAILLLALFASGLAQAVSYGDIVKIQKAASMIDTVNGVAEKLALANPAIVDHLEVPEPAADSAGKFVLPYSENGELTAWAQKALTAQASAAIAGKASDKAVDQLAAKIPFGGALSGGMKSRGKGAAAVAAIGGMPFIREASDRSFDSLDDYATFLHSQYAYRPDYKEALAAAMAIYPKLEKRYKPAVSKAYKAAAKRAKKADSAES